MTSSTTGTTGSSDPDAWAHSTSTLSDAGSAPDSGSAATPRVPEWPAALPSAAHTRGAAPAGTNQRDFGDGGGHALADWQGDHSEAPGAPLAAPPGPSAAESHWPAPPPNRTLGWARWALGGLLALTALLYLWGLSRNGWANAFYSAAAQAGGSDWKAWFFGSLDAANSITVDKPPLSLWLMGLSVRIFGLSSWSILAPQALLGVATVGVLYATVRRWFGATAGLIAGAVLALTPVATLMFRFNNPDAMLVFLLVCAAWAMGRATERGSWRWITLAGAFVGFAFLAKSLQAFLVLPGFVAMYAVAAPVTLRRRIGHLLAAFAAMVVAGGWWVAIVELWPDSARPYIGGSQTNSVVELIFGYNGFGRITGEEVGSVGGGFGGNGGGMWGDTGIGRLFSSSYGGQAAWLLPAALAMIGVLLWVSRRGRRTDLTRAAVLGWGGWLLVTAAVISLSQGIIHEYYTVALAPAIGALVGIGSAALWACRSGLWARIATATIVTMSAWWAYVLLSRSASFAPWLRPLVLVGGLAVAAAILLVPLGPQGWRRPIAAGAGVGAGLVLLAGPAAYSVQTAASVTSGSLPSAGPTVAGGRGFGGPGGRGFASGQGGGTGTQGLVPGGGAGQAPPLGGRGGPVPGGQLPGQGLGPGSGGTGSGSGGNSLVPPGQSSQGGTTQGGPGGGAGGGLLDASTPNAELTAALLTDADQYTWVAATVGSQSAAGYQLATEQPVMAIGGFNGSDPSPTLAQFQQYVADGAIHYFVPSGQGGGFGAQNGGSDAGAQITAWVQENFTAQTIGGTTVYDLTTSPSGTATSGDSPAI
jgi:4-amino-4-deoxy-L-arabinose transferase-like glycosyltransferase